MRSTRVVWKLHGWDWGETGACPHQHLHGKRGAGPPPPFRAPLLAAQPPPLATHSRPMPTMVKNMFLVAASSRTCFNDSSETSPSLVWASVVCVGLGRAVRPPPAAAAPGLGNEHRRCGLGGVLQVQHASATPSLAHQCNRSCHLPTCEQHHPVLPLVWIRIHALRAPFQRVQRRSNARPGVGGIRGHEILLHRQVVGLEGVTEPMGGAQEPSRSCLGDCPPKPWARPAVGIPQELDTCLDASLDGAQVHALQGGQGQGCAGFIRKEDDGHPVLWVQQPQDPS